MVNLFVFIPCYRNEISGITFDSTHHLMSMLMSKGMHGMIGRFSWFDIAEMRNIALSVWYDCMKESTHLLFVDDDMGFPPELVLDMIAFNEPVVGGLYRKKCMEYDWAASALEPGTGEFRGNAFLEVEGLGCGCFLIRRDAIDRMVEHFPELIRDHMLLHDFKAAGATRTLGFFDAMMDPKGKVAEDISFCRRWRQAGGKVWANIAHTITHVGLHEFSGCYAKWRSEEAKKSAEMRAEADSTDAEMVRRLEQGEITLQQAQQMVVVLGPMASHKLRNAIAERIGAMTFDNTVYPETPPESLNGQGPA